MQYDFGMSLEKMVKNLVNSTKTGNLRLTNIGKTVITVSSDILLELKLQWIQ